MHMCQLVLPWRWTWQKGQRLIVGTRRTLQQWLKVQVGQHTNGWLSFFLSTLVVRASLPLEAFQVDQQYSRCAYTVCVFCRRVGVYEDVLHPECCIFLHCCLCQSNRETVLDYKPWLYAAESILYLYMLDIHSWSRSLVFPMQSWSWSTYQIRDPAGACRHKTLFGFLRLHIVSFNMAKINDCWYLISNVCFTVRNKPLFPCLCGGVIVFSHWVKLSFQGFQINFYICLARWMTF